MNVCFPPPPLSLSHPCSRCISSTSVRVVSSCCTWCSHVTLLLAHLSGTGTFSCPPSPKIASAAISRHVVGTRKETLSKSRAIREEGEQRTREQRRREAFAFESRGGSKLERQRRIELGVRKATANLGSKLKIAAGAGLGSKA